MKFSYFFKKLTLICVLTICCATGIIQLQKTTAQNSRNSSFFRGYVTRTWSAADGLPGNSITDCIQDKKGYLYFGTYEGLVRFDGVEFEVFNKSSRDDLNFVSARSIFQDRKGNLWIGSNDEGVTVLTSENKILTYSIENGLPNNSIRSICQDTDGNVWIGTSCGIACVSEDMKVFSPKGFESLPKGNKYLIKQLYCDTAGRIWLIAEDSIEAYVYENKKFREFNNIKAAENRRITTVSQETSGVFWFGLAPHSAVRFDGNKETVYEIGYGKMEGNGVNCIYQDSQKNIWFAMDSGVTILHDGELFYFTQEEGLCDEKVSRIIEDTEGNIWLCTDRGGIEKFSRAKFTTLNMKSSVNAICWDSLRDVMWFGADDGLYCLKDNEFVENKITDFCKNIRIRHVEFSEDKNLLISTYNTYGQVIVSPEGRIRNWTKADGLTGNKVRVAKKNKDGDIYIGATTGLSIIDGNTGNIENITKENGVLNDYIMCLFEDSDGSMWCGTDGGGIFILKDRKVVKSLTTENGLTGNVIFKIQKLGDDEYWITTGSGISRYKDGTFLNLTSKNGLGTDSVFQMIPDYTNKVWFTSNKGIFSIKLNSLESVVEGRTRNVAPKYFGSEDGIISSGVTSTSLSAVDGEGRIWFTLLDGVTIYDPVRVSCNNKPPVVHIKSVALDGEVIEPQGQTIVIDSNVKRLSIKYTGISYISSEQVSFKTKLEGFDADFSDWTTERMVSYTNLKPGKYRFMVIAQNSDEVLSKPIPGVQFKKRAAFYQLVWFWIVIAFIIAGIFLYVAWSRIKYLKEKQKGLEMLAEQRRKLTFELSSTLVETIDAKDKYTNGHSLRVAEYAVKLAKMLGCSKEETTQIYYAGLLHDVGKIGVPDSIITKTGRLTDEEYELIKQHSVIGSEILKSVTTIPYAEIGARSHHERWDGRGYPDGLKETNIPLVARIICVADSYDAMTSNRSYRNYMTQEAVRAEFVKCSGAQFDPEIAEKMLILIDEDKNYDMRQKEIPVSETKSENQ